MEKIRKERKDKRGYGTREWPERNEAPIAIEFSVIEDAANRLTESITSSKTGFTRGCIPRMETKFPAEKAIALAERMSQLSQSLPPRSAGIIRLSALSIRCIVTSEKASTG